MRRWIRRTSVTAVVGLALAAPGAAEGQGAEAVAVAAGAAGGAAAGVIVTMGWIVERATIEQRYLHDVEDIVGFVGTPLIIFPAAGVGLALLDRDLLRKVGAGAGIGTVSGAAIGLGLGHVFAGGETGRWAGAVMGAAAGLLAGAVIYGIDGASELGSDPAGAAAAISGVGVPLGVTLRF